VCSHTCTCMFSVCVCAHVCECGSGGVKVARQRSRGSTQNLENFGDYRTDHASQKESHADLLVSAILRACSIKALLSSVSALSSFSSSSAPSSPIHTTP
jgi:hypothetical protein